MRMISFVKTSRGPISMAVVVLATCFGALGLTAGTADAVVTPSTGVVSAYASLPQSTDEYLALTGDPAGNLYAVDATECSIVKIDASTQATTTISTNSQWCYPDYVPNVTYAVVGGTPMLIMVDYGYGEIFEVPAAGGQVKMVGTEYYPYGAAYDSATDTLYIADDDQGYPLAKITSFSHCSSASPCAATTVTTTGTVQYAGGLLLKDGTLYTESFGTRGLLASVSTSGGAWSNGYDSHSSHDQYGNPSVDSQGNIYYLDERNASIMVLPAGGSSASSLTLSGSTSSIYSLVSGPVYANGAAYVINMDLHDTYSIMKIALPIPPDSPTGATATASNSSATVHWTASVGATSYTVTASPGGATCTVSAPATSCTFTGLANGTPYTFNVTATNTYGTSNPSSASTAVTPASAPKTTTTAPEHPTTTTKGQSSSLANTGAPVVALLTVGLGAMGVGAALITRRRRQGASHVSAK